MGSIRNGSAGCLAALVACAGAARAAPVEVTVQGRLTGVGGQSVEGNYPVVASLYTGETGGPPLWQDVFESVAAGPGGVFTIHLGSGTPLDDGLFTTGAAQWVGVAVAGEPELPRRLIGPVPYALLARQVVGPITADTVSCTGCIGPEQLQTPLTAHALDCAGCVGEAQLALAVLALFVPVTGGPVGPLALLGDLDLQLHELRNARIHNAAAAPFPCDASSAGAVYFDTATKRFMGCDGSTWSPLGFDALATLGEQPGHPAQSCKAIHTLKPAAPDGLYWLDPANDGTAAQYYCDMTSAGGGWTLCMNSVAGSKAPGTDIVEDAGTAGWTSGHVRDCGALAVASKAEIRHLLVDLSYSRVVNAWYSGKYHDPLPGEGSWTTVAGASARAGEAHTTFSGTCWFDFHFGLPWGCGTGDCCANYGTAWYYGGCWNVHPAAKTGYCPTGPSLGCGSLDMCIERYSIFVR